GKLGVQCEAAVVCDFAVVFVEPESGPFQGVSAQVALNVLLGYRLVFAVFSFGSETSNASREGSERDEEKDERESFKARDRFHWRRKVKTTICVGCCQKFAVSDDDAVFQAGVEV